MTVQKMRVSICDEYCGSSSDEDRWPIVPNTSSDHSSLSESSDELSPIEEEMSSSSVSALTDSSDSKYLSSLLESSVTSISSTEEERRKEVEDTFNNDYAPVNVDFKFTSEITTTESHDDEASGCNNTTTRENVIINFSENQFNPPINQSVEEEEEEDLPNDVSKFLRKK